MIGLKIKRGSTFSRKCVYSSGGAPVDLTGSTVRASLRDKALVLVEELTVTLGVQSGATLGTFTVSALPADTVTWPVGSLSCDFRVEDSLGVVTHSETFHVTVENAVTQ